jgi:integrase
MAFYAGLRLGELQAPGVDDVELYPEGRWGLVRVRRSWDRLEGEIATKSAAGVRSVPVCEQLYDILAPHLAGRIGLAFGQTPAQPFSYKRRAGAG